MSCVESEALETSWWWWRYSSKYITLLYVSYKKKRPFRLPSLFLGIKYHCYRDWLQQDLLLLSQAWRTPVGSSSRWSPQLQWWADQRVNTSGQWFVLLLEWQGRSWPFPERPFPWRHLSWADGGAHLVIRHRNCTCTIYSSYRSWLPCWEREDALPLALALSASPHAFFHIALLLPPAFLPLLVK